MKLKQITETIWELPLGFKPTMKVAGRIIATPQLLEAIEPEVFSQLANTASLPGVVEPVWVMPDTHVGYGVPIGAVFATDPDQGGVISPGGIGFDINCGVRLLTTNLTLKEVQPKLVTLVDQLFRVAGAGVGAQSDLKLSQKEIEAVCLRGAQWAVGQGFGWPEDLEHCEEKGCLAGADPKAVSDRAFQRGLSQLGTLGSGNHYLEIQKVVKIFEPNKAKELGVFQEGQITIMIHCGSRGFGHQIASDYLYQFGQAMAKYQITVPDRQLACAPINSPEGKTYFAAMASAVNYAFCNRQILTDKVRQVWGKVFGQKPEKLGLNLVYDVAHNVAKWENSLLVHRKGATRALGPENPALPEKYRPLGQPVIIGGSMETASYLLLGTKKAEELTFASTCHGAGRVMSRAQAKRQVHGKRLQQQLRQRGIYIRPASYAGLAEEAGLAYKNIDLVIEAVAQAGISLPIAKFEPLGNIKG